MPEKTRRLELLALRGFSRAAAELAASSGDETAAPPARAAAAMALFRLRYAEGRFAEAWRNLELSFALAGPARFEGRDEGAALCLSRLGRHSEALDRLGRLTDGLNPADPSSAHLLMLEAAVRGEKMLAEGRPPEEAEEIQLAAINRVLTAGGLEPIARRDPAGPLSPGNIHAPSAKPYNGPMVKVSVIMPAFNAAETIEAGIRGLLAQTWANLEIIVVDDGSTDQTAAVAARLAGEDGRVRLVRQTGNQGVYRAQNRGAAEADGEFVTVCGSDDWPHPRRVEILAARLMSRPELVTVRGRLCRCGPRLECGGGWEPSAAFASDPSSHVYRRSMFDEIGPWDNEVRISADTELIDRIFRVYGPSATAEISFPPFLAFCLDGSPGQLTRSGPTHLRTAEHAAGARFHYFKAYRHWHLKQLASGRPLDIRQKSFSVPPAIRPERPALHYGLIVAAELNRPNEEAAALLSAGAGRGEKTAVINWPAYSEPSAAVICPEMYEMCFDRAIDILCSADHCETDLLKFAGPLDLDNFLDAYPEVRARRAEIVIGETQRVWENFFLPDIEKAVKDERLRSQWPPDRP
ncbi:hypothetical protein C4J81_18665 (plasmid) [Deltaproteobacteria bacterium Smac51]|nr:hypothetical protein C4J81_18665 [Deltaproteobacteria bacterium Smac51]